MRPIAKEKILMLKIIKKAILIVSLLSTIGLIGCDNKKRVLQERLDQLKMQRSISRHKLDGVEQTISSLQDELNNLTEKLQTRRSGIATYMNDHKAAIACMAAVGYSLGKDNVFSDEVNDIISAGAGLCVLAVILNPKFRSEVSAAVDELSRADADIKNFQAEINSIKPKIDAERRELTNEKSTFDALSEEIQRVESELAK